MPIYEYKCKNCSTIFEEQMPLEKRNQVQKCPNCKELLGIRKISVPMFDTGGTDMQKLARLDNDLKYTKKNSNHA